MSFRQSAVTLFLVNKNIPTSDTHSRLQRAYGDACKYASSVRWWVGYFNDGNKEIANQPRSRQLEIQMSFETKVDRHTDAVAFILTSMYTWHMDSRKYTSELKIFINDL
jgi:hypothetical protein